MLLWLGFAVMTAAVVAVLLRPLWRTEAEALAPAEADLAVYRDQLNEIEADRDRGLIGATEAEGARTEVARRILAHAPAAGGASATETALGPRAQVLTLATAAIVPLASVALYLWLGSPSAPDSPLAQRRAVPVEQATVAELVGKVETRLAQKPDDVEGWKVIAPVYMRLGRYDDAANAFARVITLQGESVAMLNGFAEASVMANNGVVTDPARKAFARVLDLDPARTDAAFGLALAKEQSGDLASALTDYRNLLAGAPADATWKPALEQRIKALDDRLAGRPEAPAPSPDSAPPQGAPAGAPDVSKMSPEEREKFITSMVDGLAQRLKSDGKDLAGWLKLIRAYAVLGRGTDASTAVADARRNLSGDDRALGEIDALAKSLNIGS